MQKHGQKSNVCKLTKNVIQSNQNIIGEQCIKIMMVCWQSGIKIKE